MVQAVASRVRHFISLADLAPDDLARLLADAAALKREPVPADAPLRGRSLGMIFEKPSLRTRLSFEMAMVHLGGHATYLSPAEVGLGRRESVADVARVASRYVDLIVLRTFAHETTEEFARFSAVPVVNGLSDVSHPCQGLTDIFTIQERKGGSPRVVVAYVGDGNNVCHSLMLAVALAGQAIRIASPDGYEPQARSRAASADIARRTGAKIDVVRDPREAVRGADVVYTDVWTSMGQEQEYERRRRAFHGYQVNAELMRLAQPDAVVMHDLPAHRGEEITDDVMDGPQSIVFDQAENRLHAQKALVRWLMGASR